MANNKLLTAAGIAAAVALAAGCSVHKQEAPSLTGPSTLGMNVTITVSPDVLTRDGASQSLVTVTVTGPTGQPLPNQSLRLDVLNESGQITDALGTLSARNVVTNSNGQATAIFTAPAAIPGLSATTIVNIGATPSGTNFGNETMRVAQLQLVPQGVIGAPPSLLRPDFAPPSPTVGDNAVFTATVVDSTGADARNQVTSFKWDFGDGGTASGQSVTHTFTSPGVFPVTLTITDLGGSVAFVTHSITVGQGQLPTAQIVMSPASPVVNQTVNFNGSGSTAAPGHTIVDFAWTFGDGATGSGPIVTHAYTQAGTYTVTLQTTDDAGRKSTLASQSVTVTNGNPVAQITVQPPSGSVTTTFSFIGSQSTAAPGRTIVSYEWNFGDNTTGSGATTSHRYAAQGTYTVTLTVTDDQGKTGIATATVTVTP